MGPILKGSNTAKVKCAVNLKEISLLKSCIVRGEVSYDDP